MKNNKIRRCPWCGSEVEKLGLKTQTIKKCRKCGGEYTYGGSGFGDGNVKKYIKLALLVFCIICLYLCVYNKIFGFIMILSFIAVYSFDINEINYQRYNDSDAFIRKKYISVIRFNNNYSEKEIKTLLSNDNIFPICFIDNNQRPVSNDICISVEVTRKLSDNSYECIFSFLPLSCVKFDIKEPDTKFIVFNNHEKVGEGIVKGEKEGF